MWHVYILYSIKTAKTYTGFSNDVQRRLFEHNISESRGFTLRYRPWTLLRTENFNTKKEAMIREKFLKTGRGREEIKNFIRDFIDKAAVSASAEKD